MVFKIKGLVRDYSLSRCSVPRPVFSLWCDTSRFLQTLITSATLWTTQQDFPRGGDESLPPAHWGEHKNTRLPFFFSLRVWRTNPKWHNPISLFKVPVWPPCTIRELWLPLHCTLITVAEGEYSRLWMHITPVYPALASQTRLQPAVRPSAARTLAESCLSRCLRDSCLFTSLYRALCQKCLQPVGEAVHRLPTSKATAISSPPVAQ